MLRTVCSFFLLLGLVLFLIGCSATGAGSPTDGTVDAALEGDPIVVTNTTDAPVWIFPIGQEAAKSTEWIRGA